MRPDDDQKIIQRLILMVAAKYLIQPIPEENRGYNNMTVYGEIYTACSMPHHPGPPRIYAVLKG
jgi:hypothetical protein